MSQEPPSRYRRVDLPEWDCYALVAPIGPKERRTLEEWIVASIQGENFTFHNFRVQVAALVLVDEDGKRVFDDAAAAEWGAREMLPGSVQALDRIMAAAQWISGIIPEIPDLGIPKDSTESFMFKMLQGNPTFRFKMHYQKLYRPGSAVHLLLLVALPSVGDQRRLDAAVQFIGKRPPILKRRLTAIRKRVWREFGIHQFWEERLLLKDLGISSLFLAAGRVREELPIFAPKNKIIKLAWRWLNDETTFAALPRDAHLRGAWRLKESYKHPEVIALGLLQMGIPAHLPRGPRGGRKALPPPGSDQFGL